MNKEINMDHLDQVCGGMIIYNGYDDVYDVLDDKTLEVRASFMNHNDARDYCNRHGISDFELPELIVIGL